MAVFWMEQLVEKARNLRQEHINNPQTRDTCLCDKQLTGKAREDVKSEIKAKIQAELFDWVIMQPPECYAKLPTVLLSTATDLHPGDDFNVLLPLQGLDWHKDSPCEILHTYLLGVYKYVWHDTSNSKALDNKKYGLTLPSIRPRKHFKALQQLAVFHFRKTLCTTLVLELGKADIKILIANILDIWSLIDPNQINVKFKLQVLPHVFDDIGQFGPAILILSNHLAPSHNITCHLGWAEEDKLQADEGTIEVEGGIGPLLDTVYVGPRNGKQLNMPVLSNVKEQHDCHRHKCKFVENTETVHQGHVTASCTQLLVVMHAVDEHYFLNMHGLHNANLICDTLPGVLTAPQPYLIDRVVNHKELAA
ncbi:hypothetical protein B0H10DRAFT_1947124 [Mycena sp. CBHHK59/15]|nr:hypothetical protein B0H10DRAFT_1947124 [Mycena sp. CBHHK59/15]